MTLRGRKVLVEKKKVRKKNGTIGKGESENKFEVVLIKESCSVKEAPG